MGIAPVVLFRAIGDLLPEGFAEAAAVWGLCQTAAQRQAKSLARAGFTGSPPEAADALFDALLAHKSAVVFSVDDWEESLTRVRKQIGRVQLAIPELFEELDALQSEPAPVPGSEYPFVLSAGERRSYTANTIIRDPRWRRNDSTCALRINPDDAQRMGVADGGRARVTTRRGSVDVVVETTDQMLAGHVSLPNGLGVDFPGSEGVAVSAGVAPNDLTHGDDRDWLAGTPWHKHTPARVEPL